MQESRFLPEVWLLVVPGHLLAAEHLQQRDQLQPVAAIQVYDQTFFNQNYTFSIICSDLKTALVLKVGTF